MSTTATAVPRIALVDRLAGQLDWARNGGNATAAYGELVEGLDLLVHAIQGHDKDAAVDGEIVLSDDVLDAIGRILVDRIDELGVAR